MQARFQKPLIAGTIILVIVLIAMLLGLKRCSQKAPVVPEGHTAQGEQAKEDANNISSSDTDAAESGPAASDPGEPAANIPRAPLPDEKPPQEKPKHDSELVVTQFMDAILRLDPIGASNFVNSEKVTYPQIAGLCIIFEEGEYQLPENKSIRKMFAQETSAGWIAQLKAEGSEKNAVFSITTKRTNKETPWKITEINLDQLLLNYASRFSDGDIHYTPLIKNPKGDESLAIYFDLDSKKLTARTQRQLSIVANILKSDISKELTISGHTDALGSDAHNLALSKQRATQVMNHLISEGVKSSQIHIIGYGKSQPRRPNTTASGLDAPDGRRANRRAEILLNF